MPCNTAPRGALWICEPGGMPCGSFRASTGSRQAAARRPSLILVCRGGLRLCPARASCADCGSRQRSACKGGCSRTAFHFSLFVSESMRTIVFFRWIWCRLSWTQTILSMLLRCAGTTLPDCSPLRTSLLASVLLRLRARCRDVGAVYTSCLCGSVGPCF